MPEFNIFAVIVAALASFLLGGIWYSPAVLGKAWMKASGTTMQGGHHKALVFGVAFVWSLLGALVFAMFLGPHPSMALGVGAGFSAGLFWVAGSFAINYLFEGKSLALWLINGGYHTAQYTLIGLILAAWP